MNGVDETCRAETSAAYAWRSGGAVSSERRDEQVADDLNARPRYGVIILWENILKAGDARAVCRVRTGRDRRFGMDYRRGDR